VERRTTARVRKASGGATSEAVNGGDGAS
jgi:hypothetical protein